MMIERTLTTVCPRDCYDTCFLRVNVDENGKIVSIKGDPTNPVTQGFVCPRGAKDKNRLTQNRVLYPYTRIKNHPIWKFRQSNWDEALSIVSEKLQQTLENHGSESILHLEYAGNTGLLTWFFPQRIWNAIGATKTDGALCANSGHEALSLHYGQSYGLQPEDLLKKKLIVYWGFNAAVSSMHMWNLSQKARRQYETQIAVVDPRKSKSAKKSDVWLNPRPGTDVALAFGITRYIIEYNYVDLDFIEKWTHGYSLLKEEVMKWTPDRIKKVTGIKWDLIERLGQAYGELQPSATMIGLGFQKSVQGAESVRAVSLIPALLGLHRSFFYSSSNGFFVDLGYLMGETLTSKKPNVKSQVALSTRVKQGEFKFIFIYNMNPALTLPNQRALRAGLSREDVFVVVHDTHWSETTDYADVVLPAPTYLEKEDLVIPWSHRYIRLSKKIVNPLGDSRDEIWLMQKLVRALNLTEEWLYEDPWEAVKKTLENTLDTGTFGDLMKGKNLALKNKPFNTYQTSTGKIEFYSTKAEELGLSPLPIQHSAEVDDKEFVLLNSALRKYTHTQFQEVYGPIPPIVHINPKDAELFQIKNNSVITLYNELGSVTLKAVLTHNVPKGVLWAPRQLVGINGEPQNSLAPGSTQKIGKGPTFNSIIVKLSK
ncbi:MAG: molybdopterin-dependent oxidoreductase [Candidatus Hermodarchaeota archaeon]